MALNPIIPGQAMPDLASPVVDAIDRAMPPWANFWRALWRRTGSAAGPIYPLQFWWPGVPAAGAFQLIVVPVAMTIPASMVGTVVYDGTLTTAPAVFGMRKITTGNVVSTIGNITITNATHFSKTLPSNLAISLLAGDVVIANAPAVPDATLADIGITLLGRVA